MPDLFNEGGQTFNIKKTQIFLKFIYKNNFNLLFTSISYICLSFYANYLYFELLFPEKMDAENPNLCQ